MQTNLDTMENKETLYRKYKPEELTMEIVREYLHYDENTGDFTWKVCPSRKIRIGQKAGCTDDKGYIYMGLCGEHYFAHRLVWMYMYGKWPDNKIDHRDGNGSNNRFLNLRDATDRVNSENQRNPGARNSSGLLGVSWDKVRNKWTSHIQYGGKQKNLGRFDDKESAHEAYLKAKRTLHEGCTI